MPNISGNLVKTNAVAELDFVEVEIDGNKNDFSTQGNNNAAFFSEATTSYDNLGYEKTAPSTRSASQATLKLEEISIATSQQNYVIPYSFLSVWKFSWGNWFIHFLRHYKRSLKEDSVIIKPGSTVFDNYTHYMELWSKETLKKDKAKISLTYLTLKYLIPDIIVQMILALAVLGLTLIAAISIFPLLLHYLTLEYSPTPEVAALLCVIIMFIEILRAYFSKWLSDWTTVSAMKITSAICNIFLKRILCLQSEAANKLSGLYSLLTQVFYTVIFHIPSLFIIPLHLILIFIFSGAMLGPWALFGCFIMFAFIPVQFITERVSVQYSRKIFLFTKKRMSIMQSAVHNIKFIKLYGWGDIFHQKILDFRQTEVQHSFWKTLVQFIIIFMGPFIPVLAYSISFICHAMTGGEMNPADVFGTIALFNTFNISIFLISTVLHQIMKVSDLPKKIKHVLLLEEPTSIEDYPENNYAIVISKASFAIEHLKSSARKNALHEDRYEMVTVLSNVNLKISKGKLIGICGPPKSGKTSLFLGIVGDAKVVSGSIQTCGCIAYVPKDIWILDGTLRENILMGKAMDNNWYEEVLTSCFLRDDVQSLPQGDLTNIGEQTLWLSESQCYRISLARALYSNSEIYLFDNPLFNLNAKIAGEFFHKIIRSYLREKTVLIISNQLRYLQDCDEILLIKDGTVIESGTHPELILRSPEYASLAAKQIMAEDSERNEESDRSYADRLTVTKDIKDKDMDQMIVDNCLSFISKFKVFLTFMKFGNFTWLLLVLITIVAHQTLVTFISSWIGVWLQELDKEITNLTSTNTTTISKTKSIAHSYYCLVLGLINLAAFFTGCLLAFVFAKFINSCSIAVHDLMLDKVFQKKMEFFEENPPMIVLSRFLKDIKEWDTNIAFLTALLLGRVFYIIGALLQLAIAEPYSLIVVVVCILPFSFLHDKLSNIIRLLRLTESGLRSKIKKKLISFAKGAASVRAYELQNEFINRFQRDLDKSNAWKSMFKFGNNLSLFSQALFLFFIYSISGLILILTGSNAAEVGVVLSSGLQIAILLQHFIMAKMDFDGRLTSILNIKDYTLNHQLEKDSNALHEIPKNWPQEGSIVFSNVKMCYSDNKPLVFKGLTFAIGPGEKIGITGSVGSGKSSLISVLLRLVDRKDGKILIDGADINKVSLRNLRYKISVLTHETILFEGSIRYNLDPLHKFSDEELWEALKKVHLHRRVENEIDQLDTLIGPSSAHFTNGERQQLGLARTVLRNNKILIFDNFTTYVDPVSEAIILDTISSHFASCTILTISSNLNIILQNNRVMLLHDGQIVEFDSPSVLLSKESSRLRLTLDKSALLFPVTVPEN